MVNSITSTHSSACLNPFFCLPQPILLPASSRWPNMSSSIPTVGINSELDRAIREAQESAIQVCVKSTSVIDITNISKSYRIIQPPTSLCLLNMSLLNNSKEFTVLVLLALGNWWTRGIARSMISKGTST